MRARRAMVCAALVLMASCGNNGSPEGATSAAAPLPAPTTTSSVSTTSLLGSSSTRSSTFASSVAPIDPATRERMRWSWRPGCPVGLDQLRLLTLSYVDNDGAAQRGELVVAAAHADAIVGVFRRLYDMRFPIARMVLIDEYQGDDHASMRANNTSGFNCREIDSAPGTWSQHAYGNAIDINPLVNPWVRGNQVDPPEGRPYADRSKQHQGGVYSGDPVVEAFASIGWSWGGDWSTSKDYQHFSSNGR